MNQIQNYSKQSQKLGLVHITSQLKQIAFRICLLEIEGIENELCYLIECKNKAITKTQSEVL